MRHHRARRTRRVHRRLPWVPVLVLLTLVAAACGGSGDSTGDGASASEGDDSSLVIGLGGNITSLDPLIVSDGQRDVVGMNVHEALTTRSADGTIEPQLAESWTSDGLTWTFQIREGVTFHDGSPLTADDVVASFERLLDPTLNSEIGPSRMGSVTDVSATGPLEVTITTSVPDPTIANNASLVVIVPAEWADPANNRMESEMMGTGPYRFVSWNRGQSISFERYDDYWGEQPQVAAFEARFMPEPAVRSAALRAGEIDIAHNMPPDIDSGGAQVITGELSEVVVGRLNTKTGPLENLELRKAANAAINREAICEDLFAGRCTLASSNVIDDVFGANDSLEPYEFDPERARQILEDEDAVGTVLTMHVPNGRWQNDRQVGEVLAAMLEDVGFSVEAQYLEIGTWLEGYFSIQQDPGGAPDIATLASSNDSFDSSVSLAINFLCEGRASGFCDPSVDAMINEARATMDVDEREELYRDVWARLHELHASMPVVIVDQVHLAREDITWEPRSQVFMYMSEVSVG